MDQVVCIAQVLNQAKPEKGGKNKTKKRVSST